MENVQTRRVATLALGEDARVLRSVPRSISAARRHVVIRDLPADADEQQR
jgi:hypothetical protein